MSLTLNPPPIQVPSTFLQDKQQQAFFSGLLNTIYQLWTAVYQIRSTAEVETVDAALTSLLRIQVDPGTTVMIQARVVARRTGGTSGSEGDSAWYQLTGAYKNINGTLTGIGTADLVAGEDQAAWGVSFSTSDQYAIVAVQGAADNDVKWVGSVSAYVVGS